MNPGATARFRRVTALAAVCWAVLAAGVGVRAYLRAAGMPSVPFSVSSAAGRHVINETSPAAVAAGLRPGDHLLAVDGVPAGVWFRTQGLALQPGKVNRYLVEHRRGGRVVALLPPLPAGGRHFFAEQLSERAVPLVGVIYLAIGLVVWRLRPGRREPWAHLLYCSTTAALLFLVGPFVPPVPLLQAITIPLVGATAFHLFTTYPLEPAWVVRHGQVRLAVYASAALLSGVVLCASLVGGARASVALEPVVVIYAVALAAACMVIMLDERIRHARGRGRSRGTVMTIGAVASFVPLVVAMALHALVGMRFPWTLALLGFFLFPASVGYGIVRRDLFDLRAVAKSSAAYGAVTLMITGLFAFAITVADAVFNVNTRSPVFSVAFLFLAILAFNPMRSRVQQLVDRFFDRDRAAYRRAVREISEAMVSMLSVREIVDRILVAVTDTMGVERAMVFLLDDRNEALRAEAWRGEWEEEDDELVLPADHPICRNLWMRRTELSRADFDEEIDPEQREDCREVFDTLDVELLVPVLFGVDLLGAIAVGRKQSGERMGPDERQLLRTLANQSSIAIENAKAFDEIATLNENLEARVDERTQELREIQGQLVQSEKMRSLGQLVAGVAHELNNPIGFVHANLQLLEEYVGRLTRPGVGPEERAKVREAIRKLLARSREGTERVKQIVQDLRSFSRTDHAELQDASLNEEIDRTLALMEPRLKGGIEIVRDYGELPRVRCYAGQLNQVFMNLLMNACDAMEGRGRLCVTTRSEGDYVRLDFEDNGPGISPELASRIFEPFFTTKPVGKGTGLGLSLSHGIVERHGGSMNVHSEPGHGTRFSIRLPLVPPKSVEQGASVMEAAS